jgi:hypothetical protein
MLIKVAFLQVGPKSEQICDTHIRKGKRGICQRRFWEDLVTEDDDLRRQSAVPNHTGQASVRPKCGGLAVQFVHHAIRLGVLLAD